MEDPGNTRWVVERSTASEPRPRRFRVGAGAVALVAGAAALAWLVAGWPEPEAIEPPHSDPSDAPSSSAAERYAADPSRATLAALFESLGGFDGVTIAVAHGAFDLVTFDPIDADRLLAANRSGYGGAENQDETEAWRLTERWVHQSPWFPTTPHDFVHFNRDGTSTMWVHGGTEAGYAPRVALVVERDGHVVTSTAPMYANRFAVDAAKVFALTGDSDWYAHRDRYDELIVDDGSRRHVLSSGAAYSWLDVPQEGLLVAHPADESGVTAVWDTQTNLPLLSHPLAGRPYSRLAVSADGTTALGVTHDGHLEPLDLATGRTGRRFGSVEVGGIDRPVALSHDGRVAFTVEVSGRVSIWFVGEDAPVATTDAAPAVLPRWLQASRAALLASALSPSGDRLALRLPARPGRAVTWQLLDVDIDSWVSRPDR